MTRSTLSRLFVRFTALRPAVPRVLSVALQEIPLSRVVPDVALVTATPYLSALSTPPLLTFLGAVGAVCLLVQSQDGSYRVVHVRPGASRCSQVRRLP